jgi:hypothetical protein
MPESDMGEMRVHALKSNSKCNEYAIQCQVRQRSKAKESISSTRKYTSLVSRTVLMENDRVDSMETSLTEGMSRRLPRLLVM